MSKRTIQIEIDAESDLCGNCRVWENSHCAAFGEIVTRRDEPAKRCAACKAAEVKQATNAICPECDDRPIRSGLLYSMCPKHELAALAKRGEGEG